MDIEDDSSIYCTDTTVSVSEHWYAGALSAQVEARTQCIW